MMEFITAPLVTGIVFLGIYKLFELFVRRRERMTIIEKMGDKFTPDMMGNPFMSGQPKTSSTSFTTLRVACLLVGMGLGLLVGFFVSQYAIVGINEAMISSTNYDFKNVWNFSELVIGASTLLFGGLGLLIAYLIETKHTKTNQ